MILRISYHLTPTPAASQAFRRRGRCFQSGGLIYSVIPYHSVIPFMPSFRRKPESTRCHAVIPAQAGIYALSYRHSGASRNLRAVIPSFRRKPESTRCHSVIPAQAGIYALPYRHSGASRNLRAVMPSFRRKPESTRCDGLRVFAGATDPRLNHRQGNTAFPSPGQSSGPANPQSRQFR